MRTIDFRVDVLRGGVPYDRLLYSSPPSIYCDADADIALSMRGEFIRNERVNYLTDELRPIVIIDGVESPVGVYRFVTRRELYRAGGHIYDSIEAYDRSIALQWAKLESRDFWPAGTSYDTVITHYLTLAGITNVAFTPSPHVLQSDREDWDVGTQYLTIVNTLLAEMNYQKLWFDVNGVAQVKPYEPPSVANVRHTYSTSDGVSFIYPEYATEVDLYSKPNVFIVILENPEYPEPMYATAVNDTPGSQLSTISRGLRIPQVYKVNNIASAEELQNYANKLRDESMQGSEYMEMQAAIRPGHNPGDTVALAVGDKTGVYREVGWSFSMQTGTYMSHRLQKVVIL